MGRVVGFGLFSTEMLINFLLVVRLYTNFMGSLLCEWETAHPPLP